MVLDINLFREKKGGNPDLIRESQRRRFADPAEVDRIIEMDEAWRVARGELDDLNCELNKAQVEIGRLRKEKQEVPAELQERQKNLKTKLIKEKEEEVQAKEDLWKKALINIGNLVSNECPVSDTEDDNAILRQWSPEGMDLRPELPEPKLPHDQLLWRIGGYDPDRGNKIAGHRGYFLLGAGMLLQQALVRYALDFLMDQGYTPIQTPYFMRQDIMAETAELAQFDEELYKVEAGDHEPKYLIATSEQPISAFYRGEWLDPKQLPIKFAGHSACFRKEAGSAGVDTHGIFRVHQFEKVEQFIITKPEDSWETHKEMIATSEKFLQSLGIPYQVIAIVSKALNKAAALKYDIEAWFPSWPAYREVVSCSNCTDYQARRLEVRYGLNKNEKEKKYVHMLNGTMCATTRVLSVILEYYQTPEGVRIPEKLIPYFHLKPGQEPILPFVREARTVKDSTKKGKQQSKDGAKGQASGSA